MDDEETNASYRDAERLGEIRERAIYITPHHMDGLVTMEKGQHSFPADIPCMENRVERPFPHPFGKSAMGVGDDEYALLRGLVRRTMRIAHDYHLVAAEEPFPLLIISRNALPVSGQNCLPRFSRMIWSASSFESAFRYGRSEVIAS